MKQRENEKKNHDLVRLNTQHNSLRDQYKDILDQYGDLKKRRQALEETLKQTEKMLDHEKTRNKSIIIEIDLLLIYSF